MVILVLIALLEMIHLNKILYVVDSNCKKNYHYDITSDTIIYHFSINSSVQVDINIVNGNGYSLCTEKPFYPFYFREPLTSYSMAFVIWIANLFLKVDYIDYPSTLVITDMQPYHQYFLFYIRLFSVLLQLFRSSP